MAARSSAESFQLTEATLDSTCSGREAPAISEPITREMLELRAPLPDDLAAPLSALGVPEEALRG